MMMVERDQHPVAHEVSAALVALEDVHAARLSAAEPALGRETREVARWEVMRAMRNGMRARRRGGRGRGRDREGERVRREAFGLWREEREGEWGREDVLGRLDGEALVVLDRVLRLDEERESRGGSSVGETEPGASIFHRAESSSPPRSLHDSDDDEVKDVGDEDDEDDTGAIPTCLSPASRRRITKRLYMRRLRAKASGGVAQLDPARLKPGRKASNKAKLRDPEESGGGQKQQNTPGETRPYKIQRELEELGIDVEYLRENGLDLFHLGALGRLMRCVPSCLGCWQLLMTMLGIPIYGQAVPPPGRVASRRGRRVHRSGDHPGTARTRRAVHARSRPARYRPARTRLCAPRAHQGVAPWPATCAPAACTSCVGASRGRVDEQTRAFRDAVGAVLGKRGEPRRGGRR